MGKPLSIESEQRRADHRIALGAIAADPGRRLFDVAPTARFRSPSGATNWAHALSGQRSADHVGAAWRRG